MTIHISSLVNLTKALDTQLIAVTVWSDIRDRLVSIITSKPGLMGAALMAGFVFGISTVWVIDHFFKKSRERLVGEPYYCHEVFRNACLIDQLSPQDKNLKNRLKTIFAITLLLPGAIAVTAWKVTGFQGWFDLSFLVMGTIGFALGSRALEYYNKNSDEKIKKFVQELGQNNLINLRFQLDLSYYCDYLRYLNISKLGKEIHEKFKDCYGLILRGCRLTDTDLKRLKEAGWFSFFQAINVSDNPRLTAMGLKCIGEGGANILRTLDLSRTDLTDDDLIQMAESGSFNNLMELRIRDNPRITGKSLVRIAENGFKNVNMLDIGGNSQLLGKGLNEWIEKAAFKKLGALGLSNSNVTERDLQQMIDRVEWFRNLSGLDLDHSSKLEKFPANISQMTQLSHHGVESHATWSGQSPVCFRGSGLFFRGYSDRFVRTAEIKELLMSGKVFTSDA